MPSPHPYEQLAALLEYPTEQSGVIAEACRASLRESHQQAAELLTGIETYLVSNRLEVAQERYTLTFDLRPVCALDVGYHIFGEDCQRGAFLAQLRESQEQAGLEAEPELPDYLPVVLKWLARVIGTEVYRDMIQECVLPALAKMRECLANADNPYLHVLQAVAVVLEQDLQPEAEGCTSEVVTDRAVSLRQADDQGSLRSGQGPP